MIELRGEHVVLRALEREHCHTLWEMTETAEDVPTEHVQLGLAQENADKWFEEIQGKQGQTGVDLGVFTLEGRCCMNRYRGYPCRLLFFGQLLFSTRYDWGLPRWIIRLRRAQPRRLSTCWLASLRALSLLPMRYSLCGQWFYAAFW